MRVTKKVMAENNAKIIEKASLLFRARGIATTSVVDVMEAAGLTHGGFYRHFSSKDELVIAAIKKAFNDTSMLLRDSITHGDAAQAVLDFIQSYLSEKHVVEIDKGCPIAALASEATKTLLYKELVAEVSNELVELLSQAFEGKEEDNTDKATALLAILVGSIVLARATQDNNRRTEMLNASKTLARNIVQSQSL